MERKSAVGMGILSKICMSSINTRVFCLGLTSTLRTPVVRIVLVSESYLNPAAYKINSGDNTKKTAIRASIMAILVGLEM